MKQIKVILISLLVLFAVTACTTTTVQNMPNQAVPSDTLKIHQVRDAILQAGKDRGWTMKVVRQNANSGMIRAGISKDRHTAIVDIPYTRKGYSIIRHSSTGFEYDEKNNTIRRHYNWWVGYLNDSIQSNLALEHAKL